MRLQDKAPKLTAHQAHAGRPMPKWLRDFIAPRWVRCADASLAMAYSWVEVR